MNENELAVLAADLTALGDLLAAELARKDACKVKNNSPFSV